MKKTKSLVLVLFLCFSISMSSQDDINTGIEESLSLIIEALNEKNDEALNQYIHPHNGIYLLLQEGKTPYWLHRGKICITKDCIENMNIPKHYQTLLLELQFDLKKDSVTNQVDYKMYIDKNRSHKLTQTIRRQKNNFAISHQHLERIRQIEKNSYRVVIPTANKNSWIVNFTFYLSYLNNNWYLSVIDFNN